MKCKAKLLYFNLILQNTAIATRDGLATKKRPDKNEADPRGVKVGLSVTRQLLSGSHEHCGPQTTNGSYTLEQVMAASIRCNVPVVTVLLFIDGRPSS